MRKLAGAPTGARRARPHWLVAPLVLSAALSLGGARSAVAQGQAAPAAPFAPAAIDPRLVSRPMPSSVPSDDRMRVTRVGPAWSAPADSIERVRARTRRSYVFMGAGAAAVAAGAIVKGNVGGALALGGTVSVFYGLFQYMVRKDTPI